jgi:hypothetical protein
MCPRNFDAENADREIKDAYDEFEERVGRIGVFLVGVWEQLDASERIGHIIALLTLIALIFYAGYTVKIYRATEKSAEAAKRTADTNSNLVKATFAAYITAEIGLQSTVRPETGQWRATVNVSFTNHGKTKTTLSSTYVITQMSLPEKKRTGVIGSYSVTEIVPRDTDGPMPNHYYPLKWITGQEGDLYRNRYIAFEVNGRLRYDDGFGEIIDTPFCRISTGYNIYGCDQIDAYLPPKLNPAKH